MSFVHLNYGMNLRIIPEETSTNENLPVKYFLETTINTAKLARERIMSHSFSIAKQANKTRRDYPDEVGGKVILVS